MNHHTALISLGGQVVGYWGMKQPARRKTIVENPSTLASPGSLRSRKNRPLSHRPRTVHPRGSHRALSLIHILSRLPHSWKEHIDTTTAFPVGFMVLQSSGIACAVR